MLCCSFVLRCFYIVLGVVVKQENPTVRDESLKVLVANHISPCDHIAVHLACGSITVSAFLQTAVLFKRPGDIILNIWLLEVQGTCLINRTLCAIVCNSVCSI
jgi:hypothetical protein